VLLGGVGGVCVGSCLFWFVWWSGGGEGCVVGGGGGGVGGLSGKFIHF